MNLKKAEKALEERGYQVSIFSKREDACAYLNREIDSTTVGIGGSITIEELGLFESLSEHNSVYWHWRPEAEDEIVQATMLAASARIYMTSANAISETGEMVNIDGRGNRIAESIFGHRKIYFIVGSNKIMPDLTQAIERAKNVAAPLNAKRLGCKTPCAVNGDRCYDCKSPQRICNGMMIYFGRMSSCEMEVVIIDEALGY